MKPFARPFSDAANMGIDLTALAQAMIPSGASNHSVRPFMISLQRLLLSSAE